MFQSQSNAVQTVEQTVSTKCIDLKACPKAFAIGNRLIFDIEFVRRVSTCRTAIGSLNVVLVPKLSAKIEITNGQLAGLAVAEMKLERKLNTVYRRTR